MELTLNQQKAVNEINNHLQIIACAGSGKTEVITRRIVKILKETNTLPENIIAFTFTEKAAESMKNRIIKTLLEEGYSKMDLMENMYIGTIHGFCFKILNEYCEDFKDFSILDSVKNYLYIKKKFEVCGARELKLRFNERDIKLFEDCIEKMIDDYDNHDLWENIPFQVFGKFKELIYKDKYLTFPFLIYEAINQINNNNELKKKLLDIRYLIVDEYQDVDDLQEKIIKKFYDLNTNICVVGDDDQTIYRFRGSNSDNMITFSQRYKNVTQIKLEENFRSTAKIVDFADSIISNNYNRLDKKMFSSNRNNSILEGLCLENKEEEYYDIVRKINDLISSGESYNDIAILVRKNKYINEITKVFNDNNIPYETDSAEYFFTGLYFKRFYETLEILANIDKAKIYNCWKNYLDDEYLNEGFRYLRKVSRTGGNRNLIRLTDIILNFAEKTDFLNEKYCDIEDRKRDIEGLCKILEDYDEIYQDYQLSARINGLLRFLNEEAAEQYKYYNFSSQSGNNGVRIMSIHKSKGLEFNNVFIIGLEKGDFPSTYNGGKQYWSVLGTHFEENKIKYKGDIEDERKLFYVAITRAKKNLFLYSQIEKKQISPFLEEAMNFNDLYIDNNSLNNIKESNTNSSNVKKDEIKKIRDRVLDYYGTARHFYGAAGGDFDRCLKMNDDEILEEARKLKII